ncbi:hypothetical protein XF_0249 [Xylella fastidiosa 9a5c]|uniref:Uncharacterized protein n=1 Tax=Xylella fastidiosa (strain 9a5c) TaxID=160492 RepID=Q9PGP9_XYLFA|nr:hypothetical protein XF_0249 [Xylella fastidiosa 9a5c]
MPVSSHATLNNRHIYSESPERNWPYCGASRKRSIIAGALDGKRHVMVLTINEVSAALKHMNNAHARCLLQCTRNRRQHNGFSNNGFNKNHGQQQLKSTSNRKSKRPPPHPSYASIHQQSQPQRLPCSKTALLHWTH